MGDQKRISEDDELIAGRVEQLKTKFGIEIKPEVMKLQMEALQSSWEWIYNRYKDILGDEQPTIIYGTHPTQCHIIEDGKVVIAVNVSDLVNLTPDTKVTREYAGIGKMFDIPIKESLEFTFVEEMTHWIAANFPAKTELTAVTKDSLVLINNADPEYLLQDHEMEAMLNMHLYAKEKYPQELFALGFANMLRRLVVLKLKKDPESKVAKFITGIVPPISLF